MRRKRRDGYKGPPAAPGEGCSDVILRLARGAGNPEATGPGRWGPRPSTLAASSHLWHTPIPRPAPLVAPGRRRGVELFGIAKRVAARRRRAALMRISLSDRSRTPLAEERGVTPIPLRLKDLEALRELGEAELADEYLAAWEEWKAKHPSQGSLFGRSPLFRRALWLDPLPGSWAVGGLLARLKKQNSP